VDDRESAPVAVMTTEELRVYARTFPSQGGVEIGPWLEKYASEVPPAALIVEVGCWLGAGTAFLALGAPDDAILHVFDRWHATAEEVEKAAKFGVKFTEGQDTLAMVAERLAPFNAEIRYHQGNIKAISWDRGPIALYVDDATKVAPVWERAMAVFKPHFVPRETILVLMDYFFFESMRKQGRENWARYRAQADYMNVHAGEFELVAERIGGTTAAVFRYMG